MNALSGLKQKQIVAQRNDAVELALIAILSILADKFAWEEDMLVELSRDVIDRIDSIDRGYIKFEDLRQTLRDETGLEIEKVRR